AVAEALHARLLRMAGLRTGVDVLISEARLKDIARRCWAARACLDRPIVMCAGPRTSFACCRARSLMT
ncbi:hypothetical protein, partial [Burkholderia cenocepacia]|uniref:hypothetical protein n=1 Tax=Burkholderia cenocepacia TaxID=95486 RepID=UPI00222EE687